MSADFNFDSAKAFHGLVFVSKKTEPDNYQRFRKNCTVILNQLKYFKEHGSFVSPKSITTRVIIELRAQDKSFDQNTLDEMDKLFKNANNNIRNLNIRTIQQKLFNEAYYSRLNKIEPNAPQPDQASQSTGLQEAVPAPSSLRTEHPQNIPPQISDKPEQIQAKPQAAPAPVQQPQAAAAPQERGWAFPWGSPQVKQIAKPEVEEIAKPVKKRTGLDSLKHQAAEAALRSNVKAKVPLPAEVADEVLKILLEENLPLTEERLSLCSTATTFYFPDNPHIILELKKLDAIFEKCPIKHIVFPEMKKRYLDYGLKSSLTSLIRATENKDIEYRFPLDREVLPLLQTLKRYALLHIFSRASPAVREKIVTELFNAYQGVRFGSDQLRSIFNGTDSQGEYLEECIQIILKNCSVPDKKQFVKDIIVLFTYRLLDSEFLLKMVKNTRVIAEASGPDSNQILADLTEEYKFDDLLSMTLKLTKLYREMDEGKFPSIDNLELGEIAMSCDNKQCQFFAKELATHNDPQSVSKFYSIIARRKSDIMKTAFEIYFAHLGPTNQTLGLEEGFFSKNFYEENQLRALIQAIPEEDSFDHLREALVRELIQPEPPLIRQDTHLFRAQAEEILQSEAKPKTLAAYRKLFQ